MHRKPRNSRRESVLSVRLSEKERLDFEAVAFAEGVSLSDFARQAIRSECERRFTEAEGGKDAVIQRYREAEQLHLVAQIALLEENLQANRGAIEG